MSLHKEVDGDGDPVAGSLESGAFTADVTSDRRVRDMQNPTLGGYINGFEGQRGRPGLEGHAFERTMFGRSPC